MKYIEHHYCRCGAALHASGDPRDLSFQEAIRLWLRAHTGMKEGHGECDARTAAAARAKAEREATKNVGRP